MTNEQSNPNAPMSKPNDSFLQSVAWGKFQQAAGFKTKRIDGVLAIKRPLPLGKCWVYVPRATSSAPPVAGLGEVTKWARKEKAVFVRAEPLEASLPMPWREVDQHVQPQHTLVLNLAKPEEELLAAMHQKTRYNIRLAEKKGVTVRFSRDEEDLQSFLKIAQDVSARGSFHFHPESYYKTMLEVLGAANMLEIVIAEHAGIPLAVHLLISHGDTVTYAHGASSSQQRELMAPHLLQWESIKRAKHVGFAKYDFYGIAPEGAVSEHPWAGITRFKLGFGGERVSYPGTFDYVIDKTSYWLYNLARSMRS